MRFVRQRVVLVHHCGPWLCDSSGHGYVDETSEARSVEGEGEIGQGENTRPSAGGDDGVVHADRRPFEPDGDIVCRWVVLTMPRPTSDSFSEDIVLGKNI